MALPVLYLYTLLQAVFDVLHNEAGFSHETLARFPEALTARRSMECKQRLEVGWNIAYLEIGRDLRPKALYCIVIVFFRHFLS